MVRRFLITGEIHFFRYCVRKIAHFLYIIFIQRLSETPRGCFAVCEQFHFKRRKSRGKGDTIVVGVIQYKTHFQRIPCLGSSTRSSTWRPNQFLSFPGDGAGRKSGSVFPGEKTSTEWKDLDFFSLQRSVARHSASERKQGDSWERLSVWEGSSCHCKPGGRYYQSDDLWFGEKLFYIFCCQGLNWGKCPMSRDSW